MEAERETEPEPKRKVSTQRRRSSGRVEGSVAEVVANLPMKLGLPTAGASTYEELETPTVKSDAQIQRLPHLQDYNFHVTRRVIAGVFLFSAIRQGLCNYLTASGIASEHVALEASIKAVSTFGIMLSAFWGTHTLTGPCCRSQSIVFFTVWSTVCYAVVFPLSGSLAVLTMFPNVLLALVMSMPWSQRRCSAFVLLTLILIAQLMLTFIVSTLPLIQGMLPTLLRQFLVPVMKTFYMGVVTEVFTWAWKTLYRRPCSPFLLTGILLMALVSAQTMEVVGLLATVDSGNIWFNAAVFCAIAIIMETNSRSGILISFAYKLMGKKYQFSDAAHIFRWGKMWASYCWFSCFSSFVVPALILGLRVKGSNFTFLRWETWALVGMYVLQQIVTDFIYVCVQHYIRPSSTLSQTTKRCFVLGEATPFFGENEYVCDDGGLQNPKSPKVEEFEPASFKVGPLTITKEVLLLFTFFEFTVSVWNNYVRGQFCIYGTFLPSEDGECA